jgi:environmental stress-induced protein Ves
MPWKNGGGTTTEILVSPDGAAQSYDWRISIAEVARSGPFSDFTGYDRTIMLIEGAGFALDFGDHTQRLDRPFEPFAFSGARKTDCTLINGPVRDFNLIASSTGPRAGLEVVRLQHDAAIATAPTVVLHVLEGTAKACGKELTAGDTLRVDDATAPIALTAATPAIVAVIRIGAR